MQKVFVRSQFVSVMLPDVTSFYIADASTFNLADTPAGLEHHPRFSPDFVHIALVKSNPVYNDVMCVRIQASKLEFWAVFLCSFSGISTSITYILAACAFVTRES